MVELVKNFIDFFLHLDVHLGQAIQTYGSYIYALLFLIVFCETGLVVTPILPGDSLLFAAGTFAALGSLKVWLLWALLCAAAVLGDTVNYWVGHLVGPRAFTIDTWFLRKKYLDQTHEFFERYGGKTIIIARFVPIVRTFAPFVAGVGSMTYARFLSYNVIGGVLWASVCVFSGYFFGNIPVVKKNFTIVILGIIIVSVLPTFIEYFRQRYARKGRKAPVE
jgi:membrane-associated protein